MGIESKPTKSPAGTVTQLFEYPDSTFVENLHHHPNGQDILITTLASGNLSSVNVHAAKPSAKVIATLTGSTGLTGLSPLGGDSGLFAVSGGVFLAETISFVPGSVNLYVVSIPADGHGAAKVLDTINFANTTMMNGMAALPRRPHTILSADSIGGRILRVDTRTRKTSVAFADPALAVDPSISSVPLGVNGLKIRSDYLYFTNSAQGTFARVRIDDDGNKIGSVEIVARVPGPVSFANLYDDFDIDHRGNVYAARQSDFLDRITPGGVRSTFASGATVIRRPTSVLVAKDGKSVYVSTAGNVVDDVSYGGQILNVSI
ncbi:hypothetical protein B0T22DRAFT_378492 [Podospora appendiculata]|uniref:SMP-30/Gluconolactonase/LRE-like region domain-containing protein n=1 Tax=Podospora appendiculata TaxID=314037 RepID=A0AAE0X856_9PEZI|nr:hypothetical protein B0T22DRAFT_378492 [Podospora appendiculata]